MSDPIEDRSITHDGITTTYLEAGPADAPETLVLVHDGWYGADARTLWEPLIPLLADGYRVLAPDMIGFGRTDKAVWFDRSMYAYRAQHLASFVRAVCGDARVHAVGTSMGGSILLRDAASENPVIPAASVVSISGSGGPWRSEFGAAELGRYDGTREDIARVLAHMADLADADAWIDARHENTRIPGHAECMRAAGAAKHPAITRTPPQDTWPARLAEVRVPVTVVAGRQDPLLEPGWQKNLDGVSALVETTELDAKHAPSLDHVEAVAELVRATVGRAS